MKKISLLILMIVFSSIVLGQSFSKKTFKDKEYVISDTIRIKNGHDELVSVSFVGIFTQKVWNDYVDSQKAIQDSLNIKYSVNYTVTDSTVFTMINEIISSKAQYQLKNHISFVPLKSQFFFWYEREDKFVCDYKMMGRNVYGNLTEVSVPIEFNIVGSKLIFHK